MSLKDALKDHIRIADLKGFAGDGDQLCDYLIGREPEATRDDVAEALLELANERQSEGEYYNLQAEFLRALQKFRSTLAEGADLQKAVLERYQAGDAQAIELVALMEQVQIAEDAFVAAGGAA
ncbi:hypothetical protein [Ochrobactrum teleogrylli]|uniref:Uncharacterized protein n=1 Tax=Ochrobactrum teleogrylli TaxID=2479765 RepID=A0ABD5JTG2_9HYPH